MTDGVWEYSRGFRYATNRPVWFEIFFNKYLWYRKWCGGHWECWFNDVTHTFMWDRLPECTQLEHNIVRAIRPPCCYGTPKCEDYCETK